MNEPQYSTDGQVFDQTEFVGDGPKRVLVAVDGSPTSLRAMSYAAGLARRNHSLLLLVHVHSGPGSLGLLALDIPALAPRGMNPAGIVSFTQVARAIARKYAIQVVLVLRDGDPVREIASIASEVQADEVVVGCSCSPFHLFAASVPSRLASLRTWPVTVVP